MAPRKTSKTKPKAEATSEAKAEMATAGQSESEARQKDAGTLGDDKVIVQDAQGRPVVVDRNQNPATLPYPSATNPALALNDPPEGTPMRRQR